MASLAQAMPAMAECSLFPEALLSTLREVQNQLSALDPSDKYGEHLVDHGLLGLLADLLHSKKEMELVVLEIIGNLALRSPEMNRRVANDQELVETLLEHVSDTDFDVSSAAINATLDLSVTTDGRKALHASNALDRFMFVFLWVAHFMVTRPDREAKVLRNYFKKALVAAEEHLMRHSEFKLEDVPKPLLCCTYLSLRGLWVAKHSSRKRGLSSKRAFLPRFLARLGMERLGFRYLGCSRDVIIRTFLGRTDHFLKQHWEQSPALINGLLNGASHELILLRDFQTLEPRTFLRSFIDGSVGCPAVSSDEINPQQLFREIQRRLGGPLLYEQDIRLLRCESKAINAQEEHYFSGEDRTGRVVQADDCISAFEAGYTVAIRGMEFRSPTVAAFCDTLGSMLGQPGIGANLYLTPANSQGLSRHYDDHCVFVVQLAGQKRWHVHRPTYSLPQLYAPRQIPTCVNESAMEILLKQGEVLYVPRGFAHQAFTEDCSKRKRRGTKRSYASLHSAEAGCCSTESRKPCRADYPYSMHLTFGVEVENPFAWEGFMHIALHNFFIQVADSKTKDARLCKFLLHFALRKVAENTLELRKACLVEAVASGIPDPHEAFKSLVEVMARNLQFEEASAAATEGLYKDNLVWMNWFHHLPNAQDCCSRSLLKSLRKGERNGTCRALFYKRKSEFVNLAVLNSSSVFEGTKVVFKSLLDKYTLCRRKHAFGLLALHHWYSEERNGPAARDF